MKKLKINKKIVTVATYTIAILCAINFAIYPGTNAIFKKDNDRALAYETNLKDVYKDSIINPERKDLVDLVATNNEKTTPTNAVFGIPFKIDTENKGVYRISMSNTKGVCTVLGTTDATPINLTLKEIENSDPKDYYLTPINESVTTGTVYVSCPVAINDTNYKVKLYEHVETTVGETIEVEDEFLYASSELVLDYNAYQSQFNDLYDEFYTQLENFLKQEENRAILEEFKMFTTTDQNVININFFTEYLNYYNTYKGVANYNPAVLNSIVNGSIIIPGISGNTEVTDQGNKYTFTFDNNFIGYVKTYYTYNNPNAERPYSQYAYFSSNTISSYTLEKTVEYMYKTNNSNEETPIEEKEKIELLVNYAKGYLNKVENFTLSELRTLNISNVASSSDHEVYYRQNIQDNAYNYKNRDSNTIRISYLSTSVSMASLAPSTFTSGLGFAYGVDSHLTKSLRASLASYNIRGAITSFDKEYPTYYEIHQDDAGNLKLVKVEVNKEDNCKYVYISDLNDNPENDIVKTFINQYIADKNITDLDIVNIANSIPGLELKTANYPTDSTNAYNFITLNSDFMTLSDMYLNGISQEEMLKLIDKDSASLAASLYSEELINSIITSSKIPLSALLDTINGNLQDIYYEAHYDKSNNKLLLIEVTPNETNSVTKIYCLGDYSIDNNVFVKNEDTFKLIENIVTKNDYLSMYLFLPSNLDKLLKESLGKIFEEQFDYSQINNGVEYEDVIDKTLKYIYSYSEVGFN